MENENDRHRRDNLIEFLEDEPVTYDDLWISAGKPDYDLTGEQLAQLAEQNLYEQRMSRGEN